MDTQSPTMQSLTIPGIVEGGEYCFTDPDSDNLEIWFRPSESYYGFTYYMRTDIERIIIWTTKNKHVSIILLSENADPSQSNPPGIRIDSGRVSFASSSTTSADIDQTTANHVERLAREVYDMPLPDNWLSNLSNT